MIGNGHAVGVATEIAQNLQGTTESGLGIDDPVVAMQAAEEFRELLRVGESGRGAGAAQLLTAMKSFQTGEELAAKNATEDPHGQEERIARADPATMVRGESAGRNDTVDVGMQEQVLSPGVERADDAYLRSQVFRIGGDFEQSLSAGGEQQVAKESRIF